MAQTLFKERLIVSGTYLVWNDIGGGSYASKFVGATIPASDLTAISGLTPGRVFVSSLSNHLHYVDEFSTLRFIAGIGSGSSALPNGRVYVDDPTCEGSGEWPFNLYWVSNSMYYYAKAEGTDIPKRPELTVQYTGLAGNPTDKFQIILNTPSNYDVIVQKSAWMTLYANNNCTGGSVSVDFAEDGVSGETLTIPAGQLFADSTDTLATHFDIGDLNTYKSWKITAGAVDVASVSQNSGSAFCYEPGGGIDFMTLAAWDTTTCNAF